MCSGLIWRHCILKYSPIHIAVSLMPAHYKNIVHVNTYRDAHKGHTENYVHSLVKRMVDEDEEEMFKLLKLCAKFRDSCLL